jgi:hypothetical protein
MNVMMKPIQTDRTNVLLGAPKDWDAARDGEYIGLPVHLDVENRLFHSFWQPSEQDIADILAGMPVRLTVFGGSHPPVAIAVTDSTDP